MNESLRVALSDPQSAAAIPPSYEELEERVAQRTAVLLATNRELLRELSRRVAAEEQAQARLQELARVSRLCTLGEMFSSMVHELGQPLVAISNFARVAAYAVKTFSGPGRATVDDALKQITEQAQRAMEITRHHHDFIRRGDFPYAPADLNELARGVRQLFEIEARRKQVAVEVALEPSLPQVVCNRIQIEQVLVNLVKNAVDAVSEIPVENRRVLVRTVRGPDDTVEVLVSDTGRGIAAEQADYLFEPFCTTKPEGLGLGLSISRSIAWAHGGRLELASQPGCGATFRLRLPLPEAAEEKQQNEQVSMTNDQ